MIEMHVNISTNWDSIKENKTLGILMELVGRFISKLFVCFFSCCCLYFVALCFGCFFFHIVNAIWRVVFKLTFRMLATIEIQNWISMRDLTAYTKKCSTSILMGCLMFRLKCERFSCVSHFSLCVLCSVGLFI